jgi:hypothetical protein
MIVFNGVSGKSYIKLFDDIIQVNRAIENDNNEEYIVWFFVS